MPKRFAKLPPTVLLILLFAAQITAQEVCRLTGENVPRPLNLQLGMTVAEAQNIFGRDLKLKVKSRGTRTFFQNFIKTPAKNSLAGIRAIYLRFDNGKLYQIEIFYENRNERIALEKFIETLSAKSGLPLDDWQIKYGIAKMNCGGFSVVADDFLNLRVEVTDETTRLQIEQTKKSKK